ALREDAAFHPRQEFGGIVVATTHEGVGHPRHRGVRETLAAAIAGRRNAHQSRVEPVLHISFEDTVLDEDIFLRWRALIVDAERAAAPAPDGACKTPVVDHGDARRRNALADPPGKGARTLAIE